MPFALIAGAGIVGGLLGAVSSSHAADQAAGAANQATQTQQQMFNTINQQQSPYRQAGYNALSALGTGFGATGAGGFPFDSTAGTGLSDGSQTGSNAFSGIAPGQFTHQFNAADLNANLAPNYQFQLGQGLGAVQNASNLQTGFSGNTLKGINDYAQNFAGNAYQNAFANYTANQTNIFNRLSSIAGLGQTANANVGNAGAVISGNAAQSQIASGAAQAAGTVGTANALAGGLQNAASWYALPQFLGRGAGSTPPVFDTLFSN
jgi:hypothetical protein